jgi:hypothetical protein
MARRRRTTPSKKTANRQPKKTHDSSDEEEDEDEEMEEAQTQSTHERLTSSIQSMHSQSQVEQEENMDPAIFDASKLKKTSGVTLTQHLKVCFFHYCYSYIIFLHTFLSYRQSIQHYEK